MQGLDLSIDPGGVRALPGSALVGADHGRGIASVTLKGDRQRDPCGDRQLEFLPHGTQELDAPVKRGDLRRNVPLVDFAR